MHFPKTALVFTTSLLWLIMVACPAASILYYKPNKASTQVDHEKSARSSISNDHKQFPRTSISQLGSPDKRDKDLDLKMVSFEPGELLLPIQAAVEVLEAFYTHIAISSHGPWAKNTPRIWIRITFGTLRLLMTATEGSTIPWEFVTGFALDMLRLTERGYTGMYTASFANPTVGNAVWVSLYQCVIGPFTDPATVGAPAKVASCLNPQAQPWFPVRGTPNR